MKVLLFANTDWYLYNFRLSLARSLIERNVEVVAMCPPGEYATLLEGAGCRVIPLPMSRRSINPFKEAAVLWRVARHYRRERPDVVHHFTIKCVVYGSIAARLTRLESVINAVTGLGHVFTSRKVTVRMLRPVVGGLLWFSMRDERTRVIVQNPDDRDALVRARMVKRECARLILGSGADIYRFAPSGRNGSSQTLRVLLATRLLWGKGVGAFVEAARVLRRESPGITFLLAGRTDSGNPDSVPQATVDEWSREGLVQVLGHVQDMAVLLRTIDIAVLPTTYGEGVPKTLIEAASAGIPLVATDVPGCREIVSHGNNGLLIPLNNPNALADAIRELSQDAALRKRMGEAGRAKVLAEFDERLVVERTIEVYREFVEIPDAIGLRAST